jgi:hypothetical protein
MNTATEWLLTAPWEPIAVRRGDPLGLRTLSNRFADIIAPDLSNRTHDARWLTILAWCLCVSEQAPWRSAQETVDSRWVRTREGANSRYEWLRPLELLWVTRAAYLLDMNTSGRQLPGIRAIKRWIEYGRTDSYFGLSEDQWNRYRQTGIYGAYRVLFRKLPGLTKGGDGWTPDEHAYELAEVAIRCLGKRGLPDIAPEKRISGKAQPESYWKNTWKTWMAANSPSAAEFLPEDRTLVQSVTHTDERRVLENLLFTETDRSQIRRRVATIMAGSKASDHAELCEAIARALADQTSGQAIALLPSFTRFADAALDTLLAVWASFFQRGSREPAIPLSDLARNPAVTEPLNAAVTQATSWLRARRTNDAFPLPLGQVDSLAARLTARDRQRRTDQISALVEHHMIDGGGLRWMALQSDHLVPTAPTRFLDASPYRFRLWQLCRLATQCGVIKRMPEAFDADLEVPSEDRDEVVSEGGP